MQIGYLLQFLHFEIAWMPSMIEAFALWSRLMSGFCPNHRVEQKISPEVQQQRQCGNMAVCRDEKCFMKE
jgi:hypothetical protein